MRVVHDPNGVRHRHEKGAWRDTRCGLMLGLSAPTAGEPDCMACIAGGVRLTLTDLAMGTGVKVRVRMIDDRGRMVGDAATLTFTRGRSENEVSLGGFPRDSVLTGYAYLDEDGVEIHRATMERSVRAGDVVSIEIAAGGARVDV